MEAIILREFGTPDSLRLESWLNPAPRPGWVTVELRASALNWHDVLVRRGQYDSPLPHVIGADGAGVRTDTGEEVIIVPSIFWGDNPRAPGKDWQILGDYTPGTYAELVSVPEGCVVPRPKGLSWDESAALPLVGLTTFRALFTRANLAAGESLLVLGASGGVATAAVSFASAVGATVVVTSSSQTKIDRSCELGAHDGVVYSDHDWVESARKLTPGGRGFDVVLDPVGMWKESLEALRPGGRVVVLGASERHEASIDVRSFYFAQYDLLGTTMGNLEDFAGLLAFLDAHEVGPPVIDRTYALSDAALAHARLESGEGMGKIILRTS